jgi:hypothetical protein
MSTESIVVRCTCGREYNAGRLGACPACGEPARVGETLRVTHVSGAPTARESTAAKRREVADRAESLAPIALVLAWLIGVVGVLAGGYLVLVGLETGPGVWVPGLLVVLGSLSLAVLLSLAARIAELLADRER